MPEIVSNNGRYLLAVQGDGNNVVYDRGQPVWDSWGYEAGRRDWPSPSGEDRPEPPAPSPPDVRPPEPSGSGGLITRLVRVTNERDGEFLPRMYSYWSNAVVRGDGVYVFAGHESDEPQFFQVSPNGQIARLGPLLPYRGTSEGWYWDAEGWVYLLDGPRLRRANPFTGEDRVVFSIEQTHPGCHLWQAHSSDDGRTHSATVMDAAHPRSNGAYPRIGTVVCRGRDQEYYDARGELDESQITPDGEYLIIKEDDDNRIVTLATGEQRRIRDQDGAVGHSDCGPSMLVGEDNIHGACVRWDLWQPLTPDRRRHLFPTWSMGHLSIRGGVCLLSDHTHLSLVSLTGGSIVSFMEHGMTGGNNYDHQVKANLDPTGRIACFMSNRDRGGDHYDVYVAPVPR